MNARRIAAALPLLLLTGAAHAEPVGEAGNPAAVTAARPHVAVPGTRVMLVPPVGFVPGDRFNGFGDPASKSSLVVTELPGPVEEIAAGFSDARALAKKGLQLIGTEKVAVDGRSGLLVQLQRQAGDAVFRKWVLAVGEAKQTLIVTATLPAERAAGMSAPLRESVLSVRWKPEGPAAPDDLGFTVEAAGDLKQSMTVARTLGYTQNGVFPKVNPDDPIFVVGASVAPAGGADRQTYVRRRAQQTATLSDVAIQRVDPIQIAGLSGFELTAVGRDRASGRPILLYQVIVFEGLHYYLMQGLVGAGNARTYLPHFEKMARSFRLLPKGNAPGATSAAP